MNWKSFHYKSRYQNTNTRFNYHWIPKNLEELLPSPLPPYVSNKNNLPEYYEPFDTLVHVTTFENATDILKNGFRPRIVSDISVVNDNVALLRMNGQEGLPSQHPINNKRVIWYGPIKFENVHETDGMYRAAPFERFKHAILYHKAPYVGISFLILKGMEMLVLS